MAFHWALLPLLFATPSIAFESIASFVSHYDVNTIISHSKIQVSSTGKLCDSIKCSQTMQILEGELLKNDCVYRSDIPVCLSTALESTADKVNDPKKRKELESKAAFFKSSSPQVALQLQRSEAMFDRLFGDYKRESGNSLEKRDMISAGVVGIFFAILLGSVWLFVELIMCLKGKPCILPVE